METKSHDFLPGTTGAAFCFTCHLLTNESLHLRSRQGLLQTLSHHWFDHVEMREDVVLKPWTPFTLRLFCCSAAAGLHGPFSQGLHETTSLGDFKELDGAKPPAFSERESHQLSQNWQSTCEKDVCIPWKPYYKDIASRFLWRAVKRTSPLPPAPYPSFPFSPLSPGFFCLHYTSKQLRDIYQLPIYLF